MTFKGIKDWIVKHKRPILGGIGSIFLIIFEKNTGLVRAVAWILFQVILRPITVPVGTLILVVPGFWLLLKLCRWTMRKFRPDVAQYKQDAFYGIEWNWKWFEGSEPTVDTQSIFPRCIICARKLLCSSLSQKILLTALPWDTASGVKNAEQK